VSTAETGREANVDAVPLEGAGWRVRAESLRALRRANVCNACSPNAKIFLSTSAYEEIGTPLIPGDNLTMPLKSEIKRRPTWPTLLQRYTEQQA